MVKTKDKVIKKIDKLALNQNINITVFDKEKSRDGIVYTILFNNDTILEIYYAEEKIKICYIIIKDKESKVDMFDTKARSLEEIMENVRYLRESKELAF